MATGAASSGRTGTVMVLLATLLVCAAAGVVIGMHVGSPKTAPGPSGVVVPYHASAPAPPNVAGVPAAPSEPLRYNTGLLSFVYQGGACAPRSIDTYPRRLCSIPPDSVKDAYGFGNRQCGSYVMWMLHSTGRRVLPFSQLNQAGYWPEHVPSSWITQQPQPGDVAIRPAIAGLVEHGRPDTGHAMFIVATDYDGTGNLLVKQYNVEETGEFSEAVVSPTGAYFGHPYQLVYIAFPPAG